MKTDLPKHVIEAVNPIATGRAIKYKGSASQHDAFEALQADLESDIESFRRLSATSIQSMTPTTSKVHRQGIEDARYAILRKAEIVMQDRVSLLMNTLAAATDSAWLKGTAEKESAIAVEYLAGINLSPESMPSFKVSPQTARRQFEHIVRNCVPAVVEAEKEHFHRVGLVKILRSDLAKTKDKIEMLNKLGNELLA